MNRWLSQFSSLLQCSELDASSIKGTILSSKSDIHVMACITLCHSLWWWHIPKQCVTPCHDNVSQDTKRHLKTLCHYLKTVLPLAMKRHLMTLSPLAMKRYLKTLSPLAMERYLRTLCHYLKTVTPCHEETSQDIVTPCHEEISQVTVSLSQDSVIPRHEEISQDIVSLSEDSVTPRHEETSQDSVTNRHEQTSQDTVSPMLSDNVNIPIARFQYMLISTQAAF